MEQNTKNLKSVVFMVRQIQVLLYIPFLFLQNVAPYFHHLSLLISNTVLFFFFNLLLSLAVLLTKIYNILHYLHYSHDLQHRTILRFLSLLHTQNERKMKRKKKKPKNKNKNKTKRRERCYLLHLYFRYFKITHRTIK